MMELWPINGCGDARYTGFPERLCVGPAQDDLTMRLLPAYMVPEVSGFDTWKRPSLGSSSLHVSLICCATY